MYESKGISNQISYGDDNIAQPTELYYDGFSATFTLSIAYSTWHLQVLPTSTQARNYETEFRRWHFQNLQIQTKLIFKYSCRSLALIQTKKLANMGTTMQSSTECGMTSPNPPPNDVS